MSMRRGRQQHVDHAHRGTQEGHVFFLSPPVKYPPGGRPRSERPARPSTESKNKPVFDR